MNLLRIFETILPDMENGLSFSVGLPSNACIDSISLVFVFWLIKKLFEKPCDISVIFTVVNKNILIPFLNFSRYILTRMDRMHYVI